MEAPCKKCERKGCGSHHDVCEAYIAFKKELEVLNHIKSEEGKKNAKNRNKKRISKNSPLKVRRI